MPHPITVRVLKYDGTEYRRWTAQVKRRQGPLIVLDAEFEVSVSHELLGEIRQDTRTVEYYWLDRWYNIFRFLNDDGSTRLWYCNVNTPPTLVDRVLAYVDLDIDVLVQPDFSYTVLDLEEFETNATKYGYGVQVKANAHEGLKELTGLIEARQFPFTESRLVTAGTT